MERPKRAERQRLFVHQPYEQNYNHSNTPTLKALTTALLMQTDILIYYVEYHHVFPPYYM
jgi:hypothetical protein